MKLGSNKNLIAVTLLFLGISFFIALPAQADVCVWTRAERISGTPGAVGSVITPGSNDRFVCPGNTVSGTACVGDKPTEGAYTYLCCCTKEQAPLREPKFTNPSDNWQVKIPGLERLSEVDCANGVCKVPWISEYSFALYSFSLNIASILAVLILMAAGVIWIVSGGDQGKIATAKNLITGSVTGLILLVSANLILNFINPDLVKLKSLEIAYIEPLEILQDADVTQLGKIATEGNPYQDACEAAKKGDYSMCQELGETQPAGLVSAQAVNGTTVFVNESTLKSYLAAIECVKEKNNGKLPFGINSAWRSPKRQVELKEEGFNAATPCCSNHGSGQALDVNLSSGGKMSWGYNDSSGLTACMNANGLYANIPGEPWHWSPTGY